MNQAHKAIAVLKGGWGKGDYYHNGKYCAVGAMSAVVNNRVGSDVCRGGAIESVEDSTLYKTATRIAAEQFPERMAKCGDESIVPYIPTFNDHPDTTLDDVIMVFEKAAVWIDEQGDFND